MTLEPFRAHVPDGDLAALRDRLRHTRWPERETAPGQGVELDVVRDLCHYWAEEYDWRRAEARLDAVPQLRATVDGLGIHVLHARSPHPDALPLVLTHGWPGSVLEWAGLIGPLTDPPDPRDAFHVVLPSLPGYGFSDRPTTPGWGVHRIAGTWARLMAALGYTRYGAAGSDWGTSISSLLGTADPAHVAGVHLVPPLAGPPPDDPLTAAERDALDRMHERGRSSSAYSDVHRTAPQTIGYALADSPAALCAWLGEKLLGWADPARPLTRDQVLDQVSLYWLTGTGASAARLYAESIAEVASWIDGRDTAPVDVPVGASIFTAELPRPSRRWAARRYPDIRYWAEHDRGGHFPALEVPDLLVVDLRAFFRGLR